VLGNIAEMSRVLDAETVLVGMQTTVAMTLVEMGVSLQEFSPLSMRRRA